MKNEGKIEFKPHALSLFGVTFSLWLDWWVECRALWTSDVYVWKLQMETGINNTGVMIPNKFKHHKMI